MSDVRINTKPTAGGDKPLDRRPVPATNPAIGNGFPSLLKEEADKLTKPDNGKETTAPESADKTDKFERSEQPDERGPNWPTYSNPRLRKNPQPE